MDSLLLEVPLFALIIVTALGVGAIMLAALTWQMWLPSVPEDISPVVSVDEGSAKCIMWNGQVQRYITSRRKTDPVPVFDPGDEDLTSHHQFDATKPNVTDDLWMAPGKPESALIRGLDGILPGGMRWKGNPFMKTIYRYHFRWEELRDLPPDPKMEDGIVGDVQRLRNGDYVVGFEKTLDYIYLKDAMYYFGIRGAETCGVAVDGTNDETVSVPVDIDGTITVRIVNPYKAQFLIHDWLQSTLNNLEPAVRNWIATQPLQDVIRKPESVNRESDIFLTSPFGKELLDKLEQNYGVRLKAIRFKSVLPPEKYVEAITRRAAAIQDAIREKTMEKAKGDAAALRAVGQAKATVTGGEAEAQRLKTITAQIVESGEAAMALRTLEAYETMGENGNTVIIGGTQPVNMLIDSSKRKIASQPPKPPEGGNDGQ